MRGEHVRVPQLDDIAIVTREAELPGLGQVIVPHFGQCHLFFFDQGLVLRWRGEGGRDEREGKGGGGGGGEGKV